jgi:type VI secretion system protein VasD
MKLLAPLLAFPLLLACASSPEVAPSCGQPMPIPIAIDVSDRWNPDAEGRALPSELRLYQLADASSLDTASFEDLWLRARETLGEALLSEETVTVYPEEHISRRLTLNPEARAFAAVAIVREPQGRTFRAVVPIDAPEDGECSKGPSRIQLRLMDYRVEAITPRDGQESPR